MAGGRATCLVFLGVKARLLISAIRRAGLAGSLVTGTLVFGSGPVSASAPDSQLVPGSQSGVSCLTSQLCVLVGNNSHGAGDVIDISNGKPGKLVIVRGARSLYSVSCPTAKGCLAIGEAAGRGAPFIVELGSTGKVEGSGALKVPPGVSLTRISCKNLYACELSGSGASPGTVELAQWDGISTHWFQVPVPNGFTSPTLNGISCFATDCVAVGSVLGGAKIEELVVSATDWRPSRVWAGPGGSISGVFCTSWTLCYATGYNQAGGLVLTIVNGVARPTATTPADDLYGIACDLTSPASCMAVGQQRAQPGAQRLSADYGTLVALSSGRTSAAQVVRLSNGFTAVAGPPAGTGFSAVGGAQRPGSVVATAN